MHEEGDKACPDNAEDDCYHYDASQPSRARMKTKEEHTQDSSKDESDDREDDRCCDNLRPARQSQASQDGCAKQS